MRSTECPSSFRINLYTLVGQGSRALVNKNCQSIYKVLPWGLLGIRWYCAPIYGYISKAVEVRDILAIHH